MVPVVGRPSSFPHLARVQGGFGQVLSTRDCSKPNRTFVMGETNGDSDARSERVQVGGWSIEASVSGGENGHIPQWA